MTNIFNGVPHDNEAAVALDSNIILFIKSDVLYTYNMTTNSTSNNPLQDTFAEIPTGLTAWLIGAGANNLHSDTQIQILCSDNNFYYYNFTITNGSPTFTFIGITTQGSGHFKTGSWHWGYLGIDTAVNTTEVNTGSLYTKGGSMYLWSGGTNYWANYPSGQGDVLYNGSLKLGEVAYGGTGQPFDGLPHNLDSIFSLPDDVTAYAFKGSMYYKLTLVSQSHTHGVQVIGGTVDSSGTIPSSGSLLSSGASVGANYIGMNYNLDCVCYDAWDETTIMAFKGDVVQFFTNEVLTRTDSRIAMFPEIGTNTVSSVYRNSQAGTNPNVFWQLYFYDDAGTYWRYEVLSQNPTVYTFLGTGSHPWMVDVGPRGQNWTLWFRNVNGVAQVDLNGNTGIFVPYGPGTSYYPTLPNTQVPDACWHNTTTGVVYVSIVDTIYLLDTATTTVTSFAKYNQPLIPPTPLPDIVVTYTSPTDYGYFASNVALVTDTEYGFNFTKTGQANADKMELYLYFATAPGAIPFNYNQLRDLKVSMKNNLVLQSGEIFFNVYTVGTAGGWYGTRTTYVGTPPLGTTFDNSLVETIIPVSDGRTDQILAISLGSNSAGQQFNFDVKKASFEILLPTTNETQRVEVQLESSFIVVDDKYWDLEGSVVGKLGTAIKPDFDIFSFTPNIIAGNYPQSGTAKGQPQGTAWYLAGTWSEWTQTSPNVWAPNGNTVELTSNSVNPGLDTNGAGWIGAIGGVITTGPWSPIPFIWQVIAGNNFQITHTNGSPINFRPLAELPQPNNFTAAQAESGMFSITNVGTMATSVLISNSVSPHKTPIFPPEIDVTFLSETQVIMRRSWEIIDTTYTLTSANVLSGQYVSPTYPVSGNIPSENPDSYTKTTPWVVLANNDSQFDIQFSGGLNNTITSDGAYNMAVNPVGPSPITYSWIANYYTSADVLISPVIGFGTTGSVSNFNITLASVPASAEYILYVCTSSENVQAFASLVIIQAAPAIPFVLDFQNQSAQIVVDATYSVTPNPVDAGTTYAYTATFNNEFDASLGVVPGFTQTTPSTFPFIYANIPLGTKYIEYGCSATGGNQGGETARLAISIIPQIPPAPEPFDLEFDGGTLPTNITADGTYTMIPYPTESALIITYTYTANYFEGTTDLGPVVGFDVTGQSSSFTFTFAGMPAGATYIKYICSATGTGLQNGETAESNIGIIEPCSGGSGNSINSQEQNTIGIYENKDYIGSSKKVMDDNVSSLELQLVDGSDKTKILINNTINYEIETSFKGEF